MARWPPASVLPGQVSPAHRLEAAGANASAINMRGTKYKLSNSQRRTSVICHSKRGHYRGLTKLPREFSGQEQDEGE
ncbi:hypothetical protein EMPG_12110 [Blastomyces silverae]|uniref:Uncharacterized protein n=1 Tax=Blastomyces silverae TaxID=2060906 RepID=A0A0H1BN22_9EURO|nr:hypothetical protein EMPG_12110 [Blastomyces silverae]